MNKSVAWLLGGLAGLATLALLPPIVIGLLEIVAIVAPATVQFQETAVVIGVLGTFVAAIFVSNRVTKWLRRPNGQADLTSLITFLRDGIRPLRLIRDLAIILALSAHYGLVTAMTTFEVGGIGAAVVTLTLTGLFSMLVGFAIAGCLTTERRWTHLCALALATWLVNLMNVVFLGVTITGWMGSLVFVLIAMALGGSIATLLARRSPQASPLAVMSHEIEFDCEHCGEHLAIAADLTGRQVACGTCGKATQSPVMPAAAVRERTNV